MDLGVRGSQIISEKLPIFNSEGYRVGSSPARGHEVAAAAPHRKVRHPSALLVGEVGDRERREAC